MPMIVASAVRPRYFLLKALDEPQEARKALEHLRQFEFEVAVQLQHNRGRRAFAHWQALKQHGSARNAGC